MTILPSPQDYTEKDFESMNRRLELLLKALFPTWTDYSRAAFGNVLKECFCFAMDVLCFYQDQQARETRWGTATLRSNIIELAKLVAYELNGATAATVDVVFSIATARAFDVPIPSGTIVKTVGASPVRFQTLTAATIIAGNTSSSTVSAEHSQSFVENFTAVGEASEEYVLSQKPFLDDSQVMTIAGSPWSKVDNFLDSLPTDKHYVVLVDENDKATIRVGDGVNGLIPTLGDGVVIGFKTGGGSTGNVEATAIQKVEGTFADLSGRSIAVSVNNPGVASGGTPRETIAQARIRAPRSLRVLERSIARTDYEDVALQISGVARALMLTKREDSVVPEGRGYLYLVPVGGGNPTLALRTQVESFIRTEYPIPLNFDFEVRAVTIYKVVDIKAWIYLSQDVDSAEVVTAIRTALSDYFAPLEDDGTPNEIVTWGYYYKDATGDTDPKVALSAIVNIIHDTTGVRRLGTSADGEGTRLNGRYQSDPASPDTGIEDDVDLLVREFPSSGNIKLIDGDTGATLYNGSID